MNRFTWVVATISMFLIGCEPKRPGALRAVLVDVRTGRVSAIALRETTVGEYGAFVRWIDAGGDHRFCHPSEPARKDHRPGSVRARYLEDPNGPIVGVDWFDAYAYCAWRGRRLPTRDEWFAAATSPGGTSIVLPSRGRLVELETGVSEWCDDDDGGPNAAICGGNRFLDERAARRVIGRSRLHRQASVGFRVAWSIAPGCAPVRSH